MSQTLSFRRGATKARKKASGGDSNVGKSLECFYCGKDDQKRGDDECPRPRYLTKKRKEEKQERKGGAEDSGYTYMSPF